MKFDITYQQLKRDFSLLPWAVLFIAGFLFTIFSIYRVHTNPPVPIDNVVSELKSSVNIDSATLQFVHTVAQGRTYIVQTCETTYRFSYKERRLYPDPHTKFYNSVLIEDTDPSKAYRNPEVLCDPKIDNGISL